MSQFPLSKTHTLRLLASDVIFACSYVLSRPLYFCYFVFLLPYVLRLVAFLYPLFVTIFLVLVALCIGFVDDKFCSGGLDGCGVGYLAVLYDSVAERWRWGGNCDRNEEIECVQDFGMFEMLFGSLVLEDEGNPGLLEDNTPVEAPATQDSQCSDHGGKSEGFAVESTSVPCPKLENSCAGMEEKRLENFLKILDQFERMASNVEEKKNAVHPKCTKTNKVVEKHKPELPVGNGSEAPTLDKVNPPVKVSVSTSHVEKQSTPLTRARSRRCGSNSSQKLEDDVGNNFQVDNADEEDSGKKETTAAVSSQPSDRYSNNLGTYGSMRKEKEWKRTLACKLFEERHNVDGGEGMDSLWEAYEMDSNKATKQKGDIKKKKNNKMKKEVECEEEEEVDDDGQLCCLQALKLSTGKMNLGVGRPNLVKITKAIKGIGWLHHVTKHSKKVHNNGDRY